MRHLASLHMTDSDPRIEQRSDLAPVLTITVTFSLRSCVLRVTSDVFAHRDRSE
jgi:hypothetical protein